MANPAAKDVPVGGGTMIVTQTIIVTFTWDEHDSEFGTQLLKEGFKQEICSAGITYSRSQNTAWKVGKEEP